MRVDAARFLALADAAPWWATTAGMLTVALVGLLVVTFGGLALAVLLGLLTARRRRRGGDDETGAGPAPPRVE